MDIACTVDLVDTAGIPDSARKRSLSFDEPEIEERVKRPLNAFMVWSQVTMELL